MRTESIRSHTQILSLILRLSLTYNPSAEKVRNFGKHLLNVDIYQRTHKPTMPYRSHKYHKVQPYSTVNLFLFPFKYSVFIRISDVYLMHIHSKQTTSYTRFDVPCS